MNKYNLEKCNRNSFRFTFLKTREHAVSCDLYGRANGSCGTYTKQMSYCSAILYVHAKTGTKRGGNVLSFTLSCMETMSSFMFS